MGENNSIVTTVRFPRWVWSKLKHLQADGKVKSIQDAVAKGLALYFRFLDSRADKDDEKMEGKGTK